MAVQFGMTVAQIIGQLTRGFMKAMGRKPDGLEKIKIQQEAVQRFKDMNKVVDMEGNVIDTSKGIMGGKQIKKAMGGRIALKEGNGEDDSLTGITMTIEERMKRIRKLMEELEKAKKGIGIDPDPEDDLGGGGDFGSFKDFIENAAGATGDFELLDLYDDFLKTGDDSKMMSRLKSLGYDMTDDFAAGGIAGMLGE